jgi:predicted dehydrogenase
MCDAMIEAARRRNLLLAIDFGDRYRPEVRRVKRSADAGESGWMLFGDARMREYRSQHYYDSRGGWRGTGGTILMTTRHSPASPGSDGRQPTTDDRRGGETRWS